VVISNLKNSWKHWPLVITVGVILTSVIKFVIKITEE